MMMHDVRRIAMIAIVSTVFLTTSRDAYSSHGSHPGMTKNEDPVCSDRSTQDSVQRMKAVQSLRETQVEIEMMKKQQGVTAGR
jgi:hypothetical protein